MQEGDIVSHLLAVESQAYSLVVEAQAESDRRSAEYENNLRTKYEALYAQRRTELAERYQQETAKINAEHTKELAAYRAELNNQVPQTEAFQAVLQALLVQSPTKELRLVSHGQVDESSD